MIMQIYVMIQHVAKHGFQKKTGSQDGKKTKEKVIGKKYAMQ